MNAEKELLLALLVEKYTSKTEKIAQPKTAITRAKHHRRVRGKIHKWTDAEKREVVERIKAGHSFRFVANTMGLRVSQVKNMHYKVINKAVK